jgi:hypothetical protein
VTAIFQVGRELGRSHEHRKGALRAWCATLRGSPPATLPMGAETIGYSKLNMSVSAVLMLITFCPYSSSLSPAGSR